MSMKGTRVAATIATINNIPGKDDDFFPNNNNIDDAMRKYILVFCLNPVAGLRFTEFRVWSCERSEDDTKMMMYEYLRAAETKQKFKLKIRSKQRVDAAAAKSPKKTGVGLAPPPSTPGGGRLAPPPTGDTKRMAKATSLAITATPAKSRPNDRLNLFRCNGRLFWYLSYYGALTGKHERRSHADNANARIWHSCSSCQA
jgi:hypothetical protein